MGLKMRAAGGVRRCASSMHHYRDSTAAIASLEIHVVAAAASIAFSVQNFIETFHVYHHRVDGDLFIARAMMCLPGGTGIGCGGSLTCPLPAVPK